MKEKVFILYIGMILLVGGCYDDKGNYDYTDIGDITITGIENSYTAIGNDILEKPDRLTDEEFDTMKHHASYTYRILSDIDDFDEIRDWAAFHHERLDGTGYPFGKSADELNECERIMACVDIYQALTESRPYKKGMTHEKAIGILEDMAQKGWLDKNIVLKTDECFSV